ncbi:hypothetical protein BFK02_001591 [Salmonella enterica subsp. enterica serovar Java]|uniref:Phage virulence factor n=2 Tax=Salmonella enterica TaxID=28901 RepID=A0A8F7URP3_SALER|nr:hypothetical protein [Salmonella enterica]EBK2698388.1 hypothetical protein [Salmonella enterica subsp. enterica serovar Paratyphi B]ECD9376558.1 hypothetical protein [Salmonella enterica subsp. salamae serovar Sofia]EDS8304750.1 hypothetical protein [Salmonella enterica subsp. enterica serovar Java]EDT7497299.1 hypothetical protein [Salmonella enterica subsp. enterica serovar Schleissheim]EDV4530174.1 hypothetical protein [Salmonella enterica subsp. enterica]EHJ5090995.1 hypothetical prot
MKHVKTKLLIVSLGAAVFSASAMAGDPGPKCPHLDIEKICAPYKPKPGELWIPPPYPYNLICHPK